LSGLVPNKDKCVWSPSQQLDRLGFRWDLKQFLLSVPDRKKIRLVWIYHTYIRKFNCS